MLLCSATWFWRGVHTIRINTALPLRPTSICLSQHAPVFSQSFFLLSWTSIVRPFPSPRPLSDITPALTLGDCDSLPSRTLQGHPQGHMIIVCLLDLCSCRFLGSVILKRRVCFLWCIVISLQTCPTHVSLMSLCSFCELSSLARSFFSALQTRQRLSNLQNARLTNPPSVRLSAFWVFASFGGLSLHAAFGLS